MYYCYWRIWKNILSCWNLREVDTNIWNLDFLSVTQEEGSLICMSPVTVECCLMKHTPTTAHTLPPSLYQVGTLTSASEHLSTASCQLSTLHTTYTQVILSESSCWLGCRSKEIVLLRITRPVLISEKNNVILSLHLYGFLHFSRYLITWCMASELHVYRQARPRISSCYRSFKQRWHLCLRFLLHHAFLFISFHFPA